MDELEHLRYPVGRFERRSNPLSRDASAEFIQVIARTPATIRSLVEHLSESLLETPYRPDGWTIRQVVHHLPDSHMNTYIRMKLAVTEETPTIKAYDEAKWAELPDARSGPISPSLDLLDALHQRWVRFLRALSEAELRKTYVHPTMGTVAISQAIALYAWHGRHHAAHIRNALQERGQSVEV
jgi:hypothetical protein